MRDNYLRKRRMRAHRQCQPESDTPPAAGFALWIKQGRYGWEAIVEGTHAECEAVWSRFEPWDDLLLPCELVVLPIGRTPTGVDPGTARYFEEGSGND